MNSSQQPSCLSSRRISASIVGAVSVLTFLFLLVAIGLAVLLVRARRRIADLQLEAAEPSPQIEAIRQEIDATRIDLVRHEAVLIEAPLGVVVVDVTGDTLYSNRMATRYLSVNTDDAVVGLRLRSLIAETVASAEPVENQIDLFSPIPRTILVRGVPLFDGDIRIGTAAFVEDLTTRSRIDSIRSDFIANASHELKTPLGALRLLAEALVTTDNETVRDGLGERIQDEAVRMTRLIDDILDLALVEGAHQAHEVVGLRQVVGDALQQTKLVSDTLGVPVHESCEAISVVGDRRSLVAALANLVENAIAFTNAKELDEPAAVEVRVFPIGTLAVVEVEDHGIGIPERHQARIFERFYRVDQGRSRSNGGTGLGLAIVKHVVQNHGGQVSVESVPGSSSIFRVELPLVGEQV